MQGQKGVVCQLSTPQGDESFEAAYLFGCDGAHSTVRHTLKLDFPGESVTHRWLLSDIEVEVQDGINPNKPDSERERTVDPGWIYSTNSDQGSFQIFPITDTRYRLFAESGAVTKDTPRADPTIDDLPKALIERTRLQWKITKTHWLAEFRINERQVEQYVHGRVFLGGDAAHIHSPAGGQGMNTGLQDACNLAWKVALVYNNAAPTSLIQTYHEERHPVAARVLKMSGRAMRMTMSTNRLARGIQDVVMALVTNIPQLRKAATKVLAEDDVSYLDSSLAGESEGSAKPGTAWLDVPIELAGKTCSSIYLLRHRKPGTVFTLILMGEADPANWPKHPLIQVQQMGRDFLDPEGYLQKALKLHADSGLLIRPDAIIAASGKPEAIEAWLEYLQTQVETSVDYGVRQ